MRMRERERDRLPFPRGHPADLAPHSRPVPRRQLPVSDPLRSVPTVQTRPRPPSSEGLLPMTAPSREIDVRGPRFAAWVTAAVLAAVLLTGSGWLAAAQAAVFAAGAFAGLRYAPYGVLFRVLVAPRLGPVREREPEVPPRFAQFVGLLFAVVGAAGYLAGSPVVGAVATGFALVAALLNAVTGFCLGCELYLTVRRAMPART